MLATYRKPRDSQRQKLYRAEAELYRLENHRPKKMSLAACQGFVDGIQAEPWFKARWPKRRVLVKAAHGNSHTSWGYHQGNMELTRSGRNKVTVVHELAHCLGLNGEIAHGPEFCGRYATLVYYVFGRFAEHILLEGYEKERIKHTY